MRPVIGVRRASVCRNANRRPNPRHPSANRRRRLSAWVRRGSHQVAARGSWRLLQPRLHHAKASQFSGYRRTGLTFGTELNGTHFHTETGYGGCILPLHFLATRGSTDVLYIIKDRENKGQSVPKFKATPKALRGTRTKLLRGTRGNPRRRRTIAQTGGLLERLHGEARDSGVSVTQVLVHDFNVTSGGSRRALPMKRPGGASWVHGWRSGSRTATRRPLGSGRGGSTPQGRARARL